MNRRGPVFRAGDGPYDPQLGRAYHRLTTIRSTNLVIPRAEHSDPPYLGRLTPYYDESGSLLPQRVRTVSPQVASYRGQRLQAPRLTLVKLTLNIFQAPNGRILLGVTLDFLVSKDDLVAVLEDCYYESIDLTLADGRDVSLGGLVDEEVARLLDSGSWQRTSDIHQLLYLSPALAGLRISTTELEMQDDFLRSLVYRVYGPLRDGFTSINFPPELNRGAATLGAVGNFASVLAGHQDYAENAYLISAVMIMSATTDLRIVQTSILNNLTEVRDQLEGLERIKRQQLLSDISSKLAQHQMSLSQDIEVAADVGLWIPSLRVENYHRALVSSVRLMERAELVARSLERLTALVTARTQVLMSEEQQLEDHRRRSWTLVVGLLTTIAIPITFILAFFGANASEVNSQASIFDAGRYFGIYLFSFGVLGLASLAVTIFWYVGHPHRRRKGPTRHAKTLPGREVAGAVEGKKRRRRKEQPAEECAGWRPDRSME